MKLENKYPVMIFAKEYNGNIYYNMGLSKKDQNGNYINGYINCKFKKGIQVDDKKKIYIKDAWLDFYLKDKETGRVYDYAAVEYPIGLRSLDNNIVFVMFNWIYFNAWKAGFNIVFIIIKHVF